MHKLLSDSPGSSAFSGKGRTLGGTEVPGSVTDEMKARAKDASSTVSNLDPQVKILLCLLGVYIIFWAMS